MTNQSNSAAERSAHVKRGEKLAPAEWPVVRMPDGTWKLKSVVALEARIAELELAIYRYINHVVSYEGTSFIDEMNEPPWAKLINDTWVKQATLEGGKDE